MRPPRSLGICETWKPCWFHTGSWKGSGGCSWVQGFLRLQSGVTGGRDKRTSHDTHPSQAAQSLCCRVQGWWNLSKGLLRIVPAPQSPSLPQALDSWDTPEAYFLSLGFTSCSEKQWSLFTGSVEFLVSHNPWFIHQGIKVNRISKRCS